MAKHRTEKRLQHSTKRKKIYFFLQLLTFKHCKIQMNLESDLLIQILKNDSKIDM